MYRGLKKVELTIVRRGLDYWGAFDLSKEMDLIVKQGEKAEVYAVNPQVRYYVLGREPVPEIAGLRIGEVGKKQFRLSLEGAYLVSRASDKKKVKVTGQAESLVLYGRDVFGSSITWADESVQQNDPVIIANKYGEALGIGRARFHYSDLFSDRITVTNEADMGLYIRGQAEVTGGPACIRRE